MKRIKVGERLLSASRFVRQGAYFADIGTDHAYLPVFLLLEGKISRAVCSDINAGPLEVAKKNAEEYGVSGKVDFVLTDGAGALSGRGITDYAICGMGGELIADIIERAPQLRDVGVRLILQPMSREGILRRYLAESGFSIIGESYSYDGGKYYISMAVEYTGEKRVISDCCAEFGDIYKALPSEEAEGYLKKKISALEKTSRGKMLGGEDNSYEEALISEAKERLRGF